MEVLAAEEVRNPPRRHDRRRSNHSRDSRKMSSTEEPTLECHAMTPRTRDQRLVRFLQPRQWLQS